jgi:hypothetical protein
MSGIIDVAAPPENHLPCYGSRMSENLRLVHDISFVILVDAQNSLILQGPLLSESVRLMQAV